MLRFRYQSGLNLRLSLSVKSRPVEVSSFSRRFRHKAVEPTIIKPPHRGYDLVLSRAASIIENIAERMNSRVLQLHCESNIAPFFEEVSSSQLLLLLKAFLSLL
jgi:hypothetical protein